MKQLNGAPSPAGGDVPAALRDLWIELELGCGVPSASSTSSPAAGGGSGASGGSGSAGGGYGLGLVAPDRFSRERILRIMRDLCKQDNKQ